MAYTTLIPAAALAAQLQNPQWIIIDCRFSLAEPELGFKNYRFGHIPRARYADLNRDLSSQPTTLTGRHPLPNFKLLSQKIGAWGVTNRSQVVVYDDAGGAFAGRLWWLLRTLGHEHVAVLDGGLQAWNRSGFPVTTALPVIAPAHFRPYLDEKAWLTATEVENALAARRIILIDARTPERYAGKVEPIDPVAGHVPKAINRPLQRNLAADGAFLPPEQLRAQFTQLIGNASPKQVVNMCGSGVTACHNLLAMEHAGLSGAKLYAGSWSDWISNRNRAVSREG